MSALARNTDPETSHAAARTVKRHTMLRRLLLAYAEHGPMTSQVGDHYTV